MSVLLPVSIHCTGRPNTILLGQTGPGPCNVLYVFVCVFDLYSFDDDVKFDYVNWPLNWLCLNGLENAETRVIRSRQENNCLNHSMLFTVVDV